MTERFYYGYHLTRFMYARDEVAASYLCNLYETEEPYNHQHFYFLAELTESGFHGDAILSLLRGMTLKVICAGDKSSQLREWFDTIHGHLSDLNSPSGRTIVDLTQCHNDTPAETDLSFEYDLYKLAIYSVSNLVQHFGCPVISMRQVRTLLQKEQSETVPLYQYMGPRQPWHAEFSDPDEYLLMRKIQLCCKQGGNYAQLYNQCYNVTKNVLRAEKESRGGALERRGYLEVARAIIVRVDQFAREVLGVHDHIEFEVWLDAIAQTYAPYLYDETGDEIVDARMLTKAQLRTLVTSLVFLQAAYIVMRFAAAAKPSVVDRTDLDDLCEQMAGGGAAVSAADDEKRCWTSREDCEAYDDIANPIEEYDMMFIEGLRNTPRDTIVQSGGHTGMVDPLDESTSMRDVLVARLCVPVHAFVKFFNTKRAKYGMRPEECVAIRADEWVHYSMFTPLWRERLLRACQEAHGESAELPFDTESCEMEMDKLPCGGMCFDEWDMGFADIPAEHQYYAVHSAYDHSEERMRGDERVLRQLYEQTQEQSSGDA
jgi:hypothetical protein